jgi:DNA polymerase-3 subunit epsilon
MASQVSAASTPASLRDNDVEYLALLDRVLLDRYVSFPEADALVASADDLGIERSTAQLLHRKYLAGLVAAAWTDGVITEQEREDLNLVATLLAVSDSDLKDLIDSGATETQTTESFDAFQLHVGDLVVFTGQMTRDRATWEAEAAAAGLVPWKGITKKVKLLVAADPDSLSGKAKLAQEYGIPVVNELTFEQLIRAFSRT